jgi:hypothetical protein
MVLGLIVFINNSPPKFLHIYQICTLGRTFFWKDMNRTNLIGNYSNDKMLLYRLQASSAFEDPSQSREILYNLIQEDNQLLRLQDYTKTSQMDAITPQMRNILAEWMKDVRHANESIDYFLV